MTCCNDRCCLNLLFYHTHSLFASFLPPFLPTFVSLSSSSSFLSPSFPPSSLPSSPLGGINKPLSPICGALTVSPSPKDGTHSNYPYVLEALSFMEYVSRTTAVTGVWHGGRRKGFLRSASACPWRQVNIRQRQQQQQVGEGKLKSFHL